MRTVSDVYLIFFSTFAFDLGFSPVAHGKLRMRNGFTLEGGNHLRRMTLPSMRNGSLSRKNHVSGTVTASINLCSSLGSRFNFLRYSSRFCAPDTRMRCATVRYTVLLPSDSQSNPMVSSRKLSMACIVVTPCRTRLRDRFPA